MYKRPVVFEYLFACTHNDKKLGLKLISNLLCKDAVCVHNISESEKKVYQGKEQILEALDTGHFSNVVNADYKINFYVTSNQGRTATVSIEAIEERRGIGTESLTEENPVGKYCTTCIEIFTISENKIQEIQIVDFKRTKIE